MKYIHKTAKLLTLFIPCKKCRKSMRMKIESSLHKWLKTEYYQCEQIYEHECLKNKRVGWEKYHLVSLGYNCFGRMTFNYWGLKPRKADGEKTMPFDISIHSLKTVIAVLENHFKDYFDDLMFSAEKKYWINQKFDIAFVHDHENDINLFKERYKARIAAFNEVIKDKIPCLFFCYSDTPVSADDINKLNTVLRELCSHKKYKLVFMMFNHTLPKGIDDHIAVYQNNYPDGYVHMDKFTKYAKPGLQFEQSVATFVRQEIESLLKNS